MPRQKKSTSKKPGKVGNFFKNINYKSPKTHLVIVVLIFSVIGGGLMIYSSFAAAWPPLSMSRSRTLYNVSATDGFSGTVVCVSTYAKTAYGPIANCVQRNGTKGRVGFYSPLTKKFSPQTGWVNKSGYSPTSSSDTRLICADLTFVFTGTDVFDSAYGLNQFGQVYRWSGYRWQVAWASKNLNTAQCFISSGWMDAQAW